MGALQPVIAGDITITTEAGTRPGYARVPEGASRGVVVLHEIFGRQPEIDRVVDRFAQAGYAAVAPDLYGERFKLACIVRSVRQIARGQGDLIDEIEAARGWLIQEAGLADHQVGVIGFCMGGGFALAVGSRFAAVSTNYGDVPGPEVLKGIGPVIGCYGMKDRAFRGKAKVLPKRLAEAGAPAPEIHTYDEVGHSFLTDGHHPIASAFSRPIMNVSWNPEVAEDAWTKIMAFFERTLTDEAE